MDQEQVRYAFTLWLQNVLNMPLSLQSRAVETFTNAIGLTSGQLFHAADEMDVNVALVDDLLHHFHSTFETTKTESSMSVPAGRGRRGTKSKVSSSKK
jgi:hypothetical protein